MTNVIAAQNEMLIDRYLPTFDATQIEHIVIDADLETAWAALRDLDLLRVHTPLLDAAMFARGVPIKVASWFGPTSTPAALPAQLRLTGDSVEMQGWLPLGQLAGREIALGAIGRFWRPNIEWYDVTTMTPEQFAAFDSPGWGRIAANFSLRPYGKHRTLASYEARTAVIGSDAARRFTRYWWMVRPFVGHIMRATLDTLRKTAERAGISSDRRAARSGPAFSAKRGRHSALIASGVPPTLHGRQATLGMSEVNTQTESHRTPLVIA